MVKPGNVDGEAAAEALLDDVWVSDPLANRDQSNLMVTWKGAEIWQHGNQLILAKNFVQRTAAGKAWLRGKAGAEKLALLASRNETKKAACVAEEANWAIAFGRKQKLADEKTLKDKQAKDKEEQETQLILKAEFIEQGKKEMMEEVRQKEEDQAATAAKALRDLNDLGSVETWEDSRGFTASVLVRPLRPREAKGGDLPKIILESCDPWGIARVRKNRQTLGTANTSHHIAEIMVDLKVIAPS